MGKFYISKIIKTSIITLFLVFMRSVSALEMCLSDDSIVIMLDPSVYSTDRHPIAESTTDTLVATTTWYINMPYGQIRGRSACLSSDYDCLSAYYNSADQASAYQDNGGVLIDVGNKVIGGEQNGRYCWCNATHPIVSLWLFAFPMNNVTQCISNCTAHCSYLSSGHFSGSTAFRKMLFKSVID